MENVYDIARLVFMISTFFLKGVHAQTLIGPSDENLAVLNGTTHTLTCRKGPDGTTGSIAWDEALNDGSRNTIFFNEGRESLDAKYNNFDIDPDNLYDLVITDMAIEDEGTYICRYPAFTEEITAIRTIEVRSRSLQMTQDSSDSSTVTMRAGEPSDIVCTVVGARPVVEVWWYDQKPGGSEQRVMTGVTQIDTDNGDGTFNSISTLQYTATKDYNGGSLRCETTGQKVAQSRQDSATLNVQYEPDVTVSWNDPIVICSSNANPEVVDNNGYVIIVNGIDTYTPEFKDGSYTLQLNIMGDTHIRCNVTNAIGMGTAETLAVPGATTPEPPTPTISATTKTLDDKPTCACGAHVAAVAVPLAIIAAASIAFAIAVIFWARRCIKGQTDKDQIEFKRQNPSQPVTAAGLNPPQTYMELNTQTREKQQAYEEPQPRSPGAQSPTYEDIAEDVGSKDRVYQELGDNSNKDEQLKEYVNIKPTTKASQAKRK